jgi:hypothetical protein
LNIVLNGCTKTCPCCGVDLPTENFGKLALSKDGLRSECKECRNNKESLASAKNVDRVNRWRNKNPEKLKEQRDTWNRSSGRKEAQKAYADRNKKRSREKHIRNKYGLTMEQYDVILLSQQGVCAICGEPETALDSGGNVRNLAIDHNHETGKIRGLLCNRCNYVLGFSKDSVDILNSMIKYLETYSEYST